MKTIVLFAGILIAILCAPPALADGVGGCQACVERFAWPWLEDCPECDQSPCGFILCHLEEYAAGDAYCVLEGENCGEGNPRCPDPSPHTFLAPTMKPEATGLAGCERQVMLSDSWRLARVRVMTPVARGRRSSQKRT